jgi:hypothetical protein
MRINRAAGFDTNMSRKNRFSWPPTAISMKGYVGSILNNSSLLRSEIVLRERKKKSENALSKGGSSEGCKINP